MKYTMRYKFKGFMKDYVYRCNIVSYNITYTEDMIIVEYDREWRSNIIFGKKILLHYKLHLMKNELLEFNIRESLSEKAKEKITI